MICFVKKGSDAEVCVKMLSDQINARPFVRVICYLRCVEVKAIDPKAITTSFLGLSSSNCIRKQARPYTEASV